MYVHIQIPFRKQHIISIAISVYADTIRKTTYMYMYYKYCDLIELYNYTIITWHHVEFSLAICSVFYTRTFPECKLYIVIVCFS